jgi:hypothetical protein
VGQFDAVAAITEGVRNDDDVTALTIVFRAIAQRERGDRQEAAAALTEALVYTNRAQEIQHMARVQRALLAADDGKHLTAKVELERVLAENPDHIAAADLLASLRTGDGNLPAGGSPSTA